MRPYPAYKDSGVEWLGEVPDGWEVVALKRVAELQSGNSITSEAIEETGQYPVYGGNGLRGFTPQYTHDGFYALIGRQGALCGNVNYGRGQFWASEHAIVVSPRKSFDTIWMGELLRSMNLNQYSTSAAQPGLAVEFLRELLIPLPPLPEQQAIARFLDKEVEKIDALVAEQRRLIALLAEKRQAVISHTVTKGLNPATPLKPSGIDWLGDIPEGWEVVAIKRIVSMRSGDAITAEDIEPEGEFPVFGGNGLRGYTDAFTHAGSYILIGRQGALCGNINHAEGRFWASEHAVVVTPIVSLDLRWLGATLETMNLNQYSTSAAQPGLSVEVIAKLRLAVPPLDEQGAIAAHILEKTAQFDALTDAATSAISLLQERRAALISAAVTGKIDLRPHFAQTLSEPETA